MAKFKIAVGIVLLLLFLPSGCVPAAPLKVGTLRIIDALPLSLALYKPIFVENRLAVEAVYFNSPADLQAALTEGELDAAIIDLVGAVLVNKDQIRGGKIVRVALRSKDKDLEQTVIIFNRRVVDKKPALIRRFLRAYEQSISELNLRPERYRSLATELMASSETSPKPPIPRFPFPAEVPTESAVEAANAWLLEKNILSRAVAYKQAVNAGFLWDPGEFRPARCCAP